MNIDAILDILLVGFGISLPCGAVRFLIRELYAR
jgi:hypothetical protein